MPVYLNVVIDVSLGSAPFGKFESVRWKGFERRAFNLFEKQLSTSGDFLKWLFIPRREFYLIA